MRANRRTAVIPIACILIVGCGSQYNAPPADPEPEVPPRTAAIPAATPTPVPLPDTMPDTIPPPAPARPDPNPARTVYEVQLQPLGDAAVSGTAWLSGTDGSTGITVELTSESGPGVHHGHVHTGTCEELGPVVHPLEPVMIDESGTGTAASTIQVAISMIMDGGHLIAYHEAGGDPGPPVVCGEIPR